MAEDVEKVLSGPVCSYLTYKSVGDRLYLLGEYEKAIQSYTRAIQREPRNKSCLVARSRCYLSMGNTTAALNDAEASQVGNKDFDKGLYQKAESLYAKGEFELALMFYHRGHKLRPDDPSFRLGIQKAREAIDNSVGSPSSVRLESTGDLSFFYRQEKKLTPKTKSQLRQQKLNLKQQQQKKQEQVEPKTNKSARVLLGELYRDKEYLEKLLQDKDLMKTKTDSGGTIQELIMNEISFLDMRTEFWRQQKPIFAREREQRLKEQSWKSKRMQTEETVYILKKMLDIDALFSDGLAEECKKMAIDLLNMLKGWTEREVPNKMEFLAHLYNTIGNAQAELRDMEGALKSYEKDLRISRKYENKEGISRALDNMGRIYARTGQFEKATEVWREKEPLVKSDLECTWLFHEIGRCYLELNNYEAALDYGLKSLASAEKTGDEEWQINTNVLVAQVKLKLGNLRTAVTFFEKALEKANHLKDNTAQQAISNALKNVQEEINMAEKAKEEELELKREKQSASMLNVSPVFIDRVKTEKSKRKMKQELDFDSDGSSSTDSVCGLYSSESGLVSNVSAQGSQVFTDRKIPQPSYASYPEGQEAQGSAVFEGISKSEDNFECEDALSSTSSDSVCLFPTPSTGQPSASSLEHVLHNVPHVPRNSLSDGIGSKQNGISTSDSTAAIQQLEVFSENRDARQDEVDELFSPTTDNSNPPVDSTLVDAQIPDRTENEGVFSQDARQDEVDELFSPTTDNSNPPDTRQDEVDELFLPTTDNSNLPVDSTLVDEPIPDRTKNEGVFSEETRSQHSDPEASMAEAAPEKDAAAEVTGGEETEEGDTADGIEQGETVEEDTEEGAVIEEEAGDGETVEDTAAPKEE
ncbi:outer dynein arm-docking complex subunit 4 isoform X5 [Narcine bancroftii]|uniref:outer dynein arm-docking complex subunit 4 isoform X5 n=1 Tax=Narcine bancroftii TaxID=1343680 RepID=UPI003831153A